MSSYINLIELLRNLKVMTSNCKMEQFISNTINLLNWCLVSDWFGYNGGCFCLAKSKNVNWTEVISLWWLDTGQICQGGTYEIKSKKSKLIKIAKADPSADTQLKYQATRHFPEVALIAKGGRRAVINAFHASSTYISGSLMCHCTAFIPWQQKQDICNRMIFKYMDIDFSKLNWISVKIWTNIALRPT